VPVVPRSHLLAYAALTLLVVVLGARALRTDGRAAAPPPEAVVEGAAEAQARAGGDPSSTTTDPATPTEARGGTQPAGVTAVLVHVAGAVRRPGVYELATGARVGDAVTRAGGPRRGADLHRLNLAAKVTDGQQILVPRRGKAASAGPVAPPGAAGVAGSAVPREGAGDGSAGAATAGGATAGGAAAAGGAVAGGVVDVNTASVEELETLDGVGPAIAEKIVAWREANGGFRSVDDLAQVAGIGPKKLEAMRARVAV